MESPEQTQRIQSLITDVMSSLSDKLKSVEEMGRSMEAKMNRLQPKLFSHIKSQCKDELAWLEKYGKFNEKDGKVAVEIAEGQRENAEQKFKEWESCSSSNDFGVRQFFENIEKDQFKIYEKQDSCIQNCIGNLSASSDDTAKRCFTGCFNNIITDMTDSFRKVEYKIDEVERKLI